MADPTSDTPVTPDDASRPRATIKLKPMPRPEAAASVAPAADAAVDTAADAATGAAEPAIPISPSPSTQVPGTKQTIKLRPPTATPSATPADVKPAIKIVPKAAEEPTGIPTAKPVGEPAANPAAQTIQLKKAESSTPTIQLKKPESSTPTIQLKKPESSTPTIQLKKPESSTPTIQLKKPEEADSSAAPAKKVGDAPVPPERKLTLKLKNKPAQHDLPKNLIPGLNIPNMPPQGEQKPEEQAAQPQPPVAAPVETQTPVPEAVPEETDGKKKKGKLPKVKKQKQPSSPDEPNWFFFTLSCLTLIAVCLTAYILFAQYMNMYEGAQIPLPEFLMPK